MYKHRIAHLVDSFELYKRHGIMPGGFLHACLANDLLAAAERADMQNRHLLIEICCYIYNEMPIDSHGSWDKVTAYSNQRLQVAEELKSHAKK